MNRAPRLVSIEQSPEPTIVCGIMFRPNEEHALGAVLAWRRREHPAWSQHAVSYRVVERKRLKAVVS